MLRPPQPEINVFQFLDAREFLKQAYAAHKKINRGFSHRYIAKAMGAASSSFFKDVLNGRASLNPARSAKFARLFCLSPRDTEYFEKLVQYTQASTVEEKEKFLNTLSRSRGAGEHAVLEAFQSEYLQKWHYAAVREALAVTEYSGDDSALAALLDPPITPNEARDAIQLLLRLNLIQKKPSGRYEKVDKVLVTDHRHNPDNARPGIVANLELARRALEVHPPEVRPFSYLTLSVSAESLHYIQEKIRDVRRDILARVSQAEDVDRLYQLNMQLFPISTLPPPNKTTTPTKRSVS
jgi:uncharacterized protein (TIGR02147 family)